jgi:hypothetical protein
MTEDRANPIAGAGFGDGVQSLAGQGIWRDSAVRRSGLKLAENVPSGESLRHGWNENRTKKIRAHGADFSSD